MKYKIRKPNASSGKPQVVYTSRKKTKAPVHSDAEARKEQMQKHMEGLMKQSQKYSESDARRIAMSIMNGTVRRDRKKKKIKE